MRDTVDAVAGIAILSAVLFVAGWIGYVRGRVDGVSSVCDAIACDVPDTGVLCACPAPNREPVTDGTESQ